MSEFLGSYGFFIVILLLFVACHALHWGGHGGHGGGSGRDKDERPGPDGHQH
jgi:hypothetical protein